MRPLYQNPTEWQYTKKVLKHFGCNKKVYSCHFGQDRLYFVHQIEKELIMTEFEKQCYGMTEQDIREQYMESITARHAGLEMVVMGILSDAQEMIELGYKENVRLYLNRAKFILSEMLETKSTTDSDYLDSAAHLDQVE
jgi:hypothetical protein